MHKLLLALALVLSAASYVAAPAPALDPADVLSGAVAEFGDDEEDDDEDDEEDRA